MTASRFSQVSRRAFLGGATMAAVTGLVACGSTDSASTQTAPASAPTDPATSAAPASSSAAATPAAAQSAASGATLPATAKATVSFTYTAGGDQGGGGMVKNPYYAVWVEDSAGALVKTLLLCHEQGEDRWLNEMSAWYAASGGDATTSEGTRTAGSYQVTWDGTDTSGARVAAGSYTICIEANREHGSESLVSSAQTIGTEPLDVDLGANGELTAAHLTYVA